MRGDDDYDDDDDDDDDNDYVHGLDGNGDDDDDDDDDDDGDGDDDDDDDDNDDDDDGGGGGDDDVFRCQWSMVSWINCRAVVIVWPNNTFTSVTCAPSTTTFRPSTSAAVNTMIVCSAVDTTRTGTTSDADTKMTSSKTCNRYIYDTALKRTSDPSLQL